MPHVFGLPEVAGMELCLASAARALHAAAVALAERCEDTARTAGSWHRAFMRAAKEADEARAQLDVAQAKLRDARKAERERLARHFDSTFLAGLGSIIRALPEEEA